MQDDGKPPSGGNVISFPNGEKVAPEDIAPYVLGPAGKAAVLPEIVDSSDVAKSVRDREDYVARQALVQVIESKAAAIDVVDQVVKEIAEELSHLKWERQKAARDGKNTATLTISRISSLRQLSEVLLKRMESARAEQLNLKSPRFREVLKLWMEFVYESMQKANVADEVVDLVFKQMEADMVDWEKRLSEL
jgi:hypothetical protein